MRLLAAAAVVAAMAAEATGFPVAAGPALAVELSDADLGLAALRVDGADILGTVDRAIIQKKQEREKEDEGRRRKKKRKCDGGTNKRHRRT